MANYWDTFKPGLLAGKDYWEDFTPEAPTETGVVGEVTGNRYQPWEKGYHNIAGLVDDSGQYDAWYDPDPPPETSRPEWGTPEGYENWKTRIGLETDTTTTDDGQTTGSGTHIGPEGVEGAGRIEDSVVDAIQRQQGSDVDLDLKSVKDWASSLDLSKVVLSLASGQPLMVGMALFGNKIEEILKSVMNLTKPADDPGIQSVPEAGSRSMNESLEEGQALEE